MNRTHPFGTLRMLMLGVGPADDPRFRDAIILGVEGAPSWASLHIGDDVCNGDGEFGDSEKDLAEFDTMPSAGLWVAEFDWTSAPERDDDMRDDDEEDDPDLSAWLVAHYAKPRWTRPAITDLVAFRALPVDTTVTLSSEQQREADEFWKGIYPKGMDAGKVRAELHDFHFILKQIPKVYDHVTGGVLSKEMYHASTVISVHDDHVTELCENAVSDAFTPIRALLDIDGNATPEECVDALAAAVPAVPPTLWFVGQLRYSNGNETPSSWELQGVFSTRDLAVAACRNPNYFIAELKLDAALPDETMSDAETIARTFFPLAQDDSTGDAVRTGAIGGGATR
jgi:hypothetical protein